MVRAFRLILVKLLPSIATDACPVGGLAEKAPGLPLEPLQLVRVGRAGKGPAVIVAQEKFRSGRFLLTGRKRDLYKNNSNQSYERPVATPGKEEIAAEQMDSSL